VNVVILYSEHGTEVEPRIPFTWPYEYLGYWLKILQYAECAVPDSANALAGTAVCCREPAEGG